MCSVRSHGEVGKNAEYCLHTQTTEYRRMIPSHSHILKQALTLWCMFGLCTMKCHVYNLSLLKKVARDEEEVAFKLKTKSSKQCTIWHNTARVEFSAPHNKCTALKYTNGSMRFVIQLRFHIKTKTLTPDAFLEYAWGLICVLGTYACAIVFVRLSCTGLFQSHFTVSWRVLLFSSAQCDVQLSLIRDQTIDFRAHCRKKGVAACHAI